jgi:flagellar hook-length control protein FliK
MNPMVTPFIVKQGAALAQSGVKEGIAAVNQKGSRRKQGSSAGAEELSSFANILSGTLAKTGGSEALKREKNAALFQEKARVQSKAAGSEGVGKTGNRAGFEGPVTTEIAAEAKAASQAVAQALKGGKKLESAVKAATDLSERTSASMTEAGKEAAAESGNVRSRKGSLKAAVKEDRAAQKLDASEVLLNRAQGVKSPKSSLAGVSEFTQQKGKSEKAPPHTEGSNKKETGESRGQKKTEAVRVETPRSDAASTKERAEGAKASVTEGRAPLTDGTGRPEDRFANILQARSESVTGRVMENPGPARPQVIIPQIVDGATTVLRGGSGRVVITLHPPQLGTVDMDIQVRDNKVSMLMLADNHEVKQVLESGLSQLKNALSEQGFQIDRVDVLVQDRSGNEFAGMLHERGSSPEGRSQAERGGPNARAADAASGEIRRDPDVDESRLVNVFV